MTAPDRRWPVVVPAALALLAAVELAAYVLLAPVTTTPDGESAGALAAGDALLVGFAAATVGAAAVGVAGATRVSPRLLWLAAGALALLGVAGTAVGPQVLVVALLVVLSALLAEATGDGGHPRRNGTEPPPPPEREPTATDGVVGRLPVSDAGSAGAGGPGSRVAAPDGPDGEVVLAAVLLVPLAALLGLSALTTPVARVAVAATAAVVLAGSALSVWAVAKS